MDQLTPQSPAERAAQLRADERATSQQRRRDYLVALTGAVGSVALGLALLGQAVHTTDIRIGAVCFWAGLIMGNGGWFASMAWAWYRAAERGDF